MILLLGGLATGTRPPPLCIFMGAVRHAAAFVIFGKPAVVFSEETCCCTAESGDRTLFHKASRAGAFRSSRSCGLRGRRMVESEQTGERDRADLRSGALQQCR